MESCSLTFLPKDGDRGSKGHQCCVPVSHALRCVDVLYTFSTLYDRHFIDSRSLAYIVVRWIGSFSNREQQYCSTIGANHSFFSRLISKYCTVPTHLHTYTPTSTEHRGEATFLPSFVVVSSRRHVVTSSRRHVTLRTCT